MSADKKDVFDLAAGVPGIEGELRPKPKFAARISKRIIGVALGFFAIILFIFMAALDNMDKKKAPDPEKVEVAAKSDKDGTVGTPRELLNGPTVLGASGVPEANPSTLVKPPAPVDVVPPAGLFGGNSGKLNVPSMTGKNAPPASSGMIPKDDTVAGVSGAPLTPQQQADNLAKQERLTRMAQARSGGLSVRAFDAVDSKAAGGVPPSLEAMLKAAANGAGGGLPQGGQQQANGPDGEQDEKLNFVKAAGKEDRGYHKHIPLPALSPNEVKTGTFIPSALEMGINSDLPGMITARVTEDIYDSVSGCRLLIPAMSKLVGSYDSKIALGQGRILVVWNSMVFRDGSELNLAGMQGYDTAGRAGLESDVDNHYLRLFGVAFGMSVVTAGVQLSVPPPPPTGPNGGQAAPTPAQALATALSQQYGQLGAQILGKYAAVQPTLRNFPGERFMIMVPHTIVFGKIWNDRCSEHLSARSPSYAR